MKKEEQKQLLDAMDYAQSTPSLSQAQRLKKLSKSGSLTKEKMEDIMSEIKKGEISRVSLGQPNCHVRFGIKKQERSVRIAADDRTAADDAG